MQRVLPETDLEKKMMSMAAIFIEENHVLDDLYEIIGSDLVDGKVLAPDVKEQVLEEIGEYFFRLDLNWGKEIKEDCLIILEDFWGVKTKEAALQTLEDIRKQGHRTKFNVLKGIAAAEEKISASSLEKFKQIFNFDFASEEQMQMTDDDHRLLAAWMKKTDRFVGECGILAWDIARGVHLARLAYVVGFFDDNQAWAEILNLAPIAEGKFKDWREFALSFIIGRTFWAGEEDPHIKMVCERLLGHPASPWNFYPLSKD